MNIFTIQNINEYDIFIQYERLFNNYDFVQYESSAIILFSFNVDYNSKFLSNYLKNDIYLLL